MQKNNKRHSLAKNWAFFTDDKPTDKPDKPRKPLPNSAEYASEKYAIADTLPTFGGIRRDYSERACCARPY